jgi:hypothetical protein
MDHASTDQQKNHEFAYQVLLGRMQKLGYEPDAAAFGISWNQLAQTLAEIICQQGRAADGLSEGCLDVCLQKASEALQNQEILPWEWSAKIAMENVLFPAAEPERDDEGPLTEEYENWSRIEDGWLEAAYEDRFYTDDL